MVETTEKSVSVNLTIMDRLYINLFIPTEGNMLEMLVASEFRDRVKFSSKELEVTELSVANGVYTHKTTPEAQEIDKKEFSLSSGELKIVKDKIEELEKTKKIGIDFVLLAKKLKELEIK